MKKFIITVDTEPDNQWNTTAAETTENVKYIPRFQNLCEKYGFKPVYLTDYIVAQNKEFVKQANCYLHKGTCEIGMHLHAWDTPPFCNLDNVSGERPYLIEYSESQMREKIHSISELLRTTFDNPIVSHRAGRWATNELYFKILDEEGYKIDCSFTPYVNWNTTKGRSPGSQGTDYSRSPEVEHYIEGTNILEVPMTVRKVSKFTAVKYTSKSIVNIAKTLLRNNLFWFRPALQTTEQMLYLANTSSDNQYIEMMLHSSELMPGGSPYFRTEEDIEHLYHMLDSIFKALSDNYEGATLVDYYNTLVNKEQ